MVRITPIYKPWSSAIWKVSHNPILTGQQRSPWYRSSKRWGTNTHFPSPLIYLTDSTMGFITMKKRHHLTESFFHLFPSIEEAKNPIPATPRPRPLAVSKICSPGGLLVGQGGGKDLQAWNPGVFLQRSFNGTHFGGGGIKPCKFMAIWRSFPKIIVDCLGW